MESGQGSMSSINGVVIWCLLRKLKLEPIPVLRPRYRSLTSSSCQVNKTTRSLSTSGMRLRVDLLPSSTSLPTKVTSLIQGSVDSAFGYKNLALRHIVSLNRCKKQTIPKLEMEMTQSATAAA